MKILMVCDFFHENQEYQENLLSKYYLKLGHDVTIVASTFTAIFDYYSANYKKTKTTQVYYYKNLKIIRQPYSINLLNKIRKLKNLKNIILEELPDMIYVHGVPLNLIDPIFYKQKINKECRLVFDTHADYSNSANNWLSLNILHKIFYKLLMKLYYKKLDKFFFITPNGGKFLNQVYGIPEKCLTFLPLGADIDYITKIKEKNINIIIRNRLGIKPDEFVIFTGGKFARNKQTELVIKSFLLLKQPFVHLIIIGDTKDELYKKEILELINSHQRIHLIGWVNGKEIYDYMLASDVAVFPASQSVLWQQAIGTGLPLIIGQLKDQDASYLNRNDNLFIIEEYSINEESIYQRLNLLLGDEDLLKTMKANAVKTAEELLYYDKIAENSLK